MSPSSTLFQGFPASVARYTPSGGPPTYARPGDGDALGTIAAAVDRIDNAVAKRAARLLPATVARAPDDEPVLRPGVQSHSVGHDRSYGNSSTLPVPGCLSQRAS